MPAALASPVRPESPERPRPLSPVRAELPEMATGLAMPVDDAGPVFAVLVAEDWALTAPESPAANGYEESERQATQPVRGKAPASPSLVTQCRSAAARGDCAAVRALAARLAAQDADTYRDQLAGDAAISRCLSQAAE